MKIISTEIRNIRNIEHSKIFFDDKTLIYGKNGSGKTSFLESVFLSITGKSFRSSNITDVIKTGQKYSFIESVILDNQNYERKISFGFNKENKLYKVDGENVSRKEIISVISAVVFTPDSIEIIKNGPSLRRNFLDRIAFIIDKEYYNIYIYYKRYLKSKQILINERNKQLIKILNKSIFNYIKNIREKRKTIIDKINLIIKNYSNELNFNYNIEFNYNDKNTNIISDLDSVIDKEINCGKILYGPHLDNISIRINSRKSINASMGEIYFLSFLLKISEIKFYTEFNILPVFLCDDVFNFLDDDNKALVLDILNNIRNQIIMTSPYYIEDININNIPVNKIL